MSETKTIVPKRGDFKPLNKVATLGEMFEHPDFKNRIAAAAPRHMHAERLLRTFVLAVQKTPKLAQVSPMNMLGAFITLASLGLEPNTPLGHAYLIPFVKRGKNPNTGQWEEVGVEVQVIIGYQGFLELIYRGESVLNIHCDVVWKGDEFSYKYGSNQHLDHVPSRHEHAANEEPIGAYMFAKLRNGGEEFVFMSLADLHAIRARSQGFQTAMKAYDEAVKKNIDPNKDKRYSEAPWIKDKIAMYKKTALRAGRKFLPVSIEIAAAAALDARSDVGGIDFSKVIDADSVMDASWDTSSEAEDPVQAIEKQSDPIPFRFTESPQPEYMPREQPATQSKPHPGEEHAQPPDVVFTLYNAFGEPEQDEPFTDPVKFANEFARLWQVAEHRAVLREHNVNAISEAMGISAVANGILTGLLYGGEKTQTAQVPDEERFYVSNHKTDKGTPDYVRWVRDAKEVILEVTTVADLRSFEAVNKDAWTKLPPAAKQAYQKAFKERLDALAPPLDDEIPDFPMPPEPPAMPVTPPRDDAEAQSDFKYLKGLFAQAMSVHDLQGFQRQAALKAKFQALRLQAPSMAEELEKFFDERMNALKGE